MRVIPVDIYDYRQELNLIKKLPPNSKLGIVSLSDGILKVAEMIINSLRGDDLFMMTTQPTDEYKLKNLVRSCQTIICDNSSFVTVKKMVNSVQEDLIRTPQIIHSESYIGTKSINLLKRELGIIN
jgi:GntR family transcriptional regulator